MTTPGGSSGFYEDVAAGVETAQQRVAKWNSYAQRADPNTAALLAQWRQRYPNMGPQTILPAAMNGVLPTTTVAQNMAEAETRRQSRSWVGKIVGGIGDAVGEVKDTVADVGKGALRGTFGVLNTGGQAIQSTFRDNYDDGNISAWDVVSSPFEATGRFVGSFAGMDDSTEIGQLAKQVRESFKRGEPLQGIDTGDGFFLRGKNEKQRVKASRSTRQINGKAASIGRWVANNVEVVEPGSTGYNVISGFVDAAVAIGGDPSTLLTGPVGRGIQASRSLTGAAPKGFNKVLAQSDELTEALVKREVGLSRQAKEDQRTQGALAEAVRSGTDRAVKPADFTTVQRRTLLPESKVRGEDGNLIRVYHGTSVEFDQFDDAVGKGKGWFGPGHYFTEDPEYAATYVPGALSDDAAPNVRIAYLDIRNPFDWDKTRMTREQALDLYRRAAPDSPKTDEEVMRGLDALPLGVQPGDVMDQIGIDLGVVDVAANEVLESRFNRAFRDWAEERGFDGVKHTEYVAGPFGEAPLTRENLFRAPSYVAFRADQVHMPYGKDELITETKEVAGAIDAHRRTLIPDKALWFLTQDKDGIAAVQAVAQTNDAGKIRDLLGGKVPAELLEPLTNASSAEEVIAALGPAIGTTRQLSAKFKAKRRVAPDSVWRRVGDMNAMYVSTNNIDDAVTNIDNMLRTAGIRDERRGLLLLQAARSTDEAELQQAVFAANDAVAESVIYSQVMGTSLGRALGYRVTAGLDGKKPYVGTVKTQQPLQTVGERGITDTGRLARYNGLNPSGKVMVTYSDGSTGTVDSIFQVDDAITNRVRGGLTRAYASELQKMRAYDTTEKAEPIDVARSLLGGSLIPIGETGARPSPASLSHLTQGRIPLLNARDIRRALAPYPNLLANPAVDVPVTAMRFITGQVFKPLVLLRAAYTVRVTMDAHARMAFAGDDGLFNHPIRAIQWMMNKRGDIDDIDDAGNITRLSETQKAGLTKLKTDPDVTRDEMVYEVRILEQGQRKFSDGPAPAMRDRVNVSWDQDVPDPPEDFIRGTAEELRRLHTDAVIRQVARANVGQHVKGLRPGFVNGKFADEEAYRRIAGQDIRDHTGGVVREGIDGTKDWLFEGTGKVFRKQLARGSKTFKELGTGRPGDPIGMRQASDRFIDLQDNILRDFTLNDPVLDLIVATGKIGDEPLMGKDNTLNPKALTALADHLRENPGRRQVTALKRGLPPTQDGSKFAATLNGAVESLFDWFAAKPDDWWSRNPVFKQRRLNELAKQVSVSDPQTQRKIVSILRANGADKRLVKQAEQAQASGRVGTATYDEVNLVAKARAFDQAKELLYDVSTRSNWGDQAAILIPFADAFADSVRTYSKLVKDNPLTLGRPSLAYQGARDADPDGDGKGFFYKDEFGKEVFAFPMSGRFTELLTGVPVGLDAPVQNLNIATTSVIPGFGPAVSIAASAVLPDDPEYDWLRQVVIPYGEKDFSSGALESFFPAWLTKWTTSQYGPFAAAGRTGAQDRAFAASVRDTMEYLASTPEYSLEGLADNDRIDAQAELVEEARSRAKVLWLIRGMAQFWAPSPPSFDFVQADKDGKLITQVELARVYREMENDTEAGGYRTAAARFLTRYPNAALTMISNTEGKEGFSPAAPTKANDEFLRRNPDVADKYPLAFGLFLDTDGEFDPTAYRRQQDSGERVPLSPEEALQRVNRRLGGIAYEAEKQRLEDQGLDLDDDEVRDYLRVVRADIARMHPGWTSQGDPTKTPKLIQEVVLAANDPVLGNTDAGKALRAYLGARDQVLTQATEAGVDWTKAKAARSARTWLRDYADQLSEVSPQFGVLFDRSLIAELRIDDEEAA